MKLADCLNLTYYPILLLKTETYVAEGSSMLSAVLRLLLWLKLRIFDKIYSYQLDFLLQCEKMSTLLFVLCFSLSASSARAIRVPSTSRQYDLF